MMGERRTDQAALFYEFSLERHVSATHLLRSIDRLSIYRTSGGTWRRSIAVPRGRGVITRRSDSEWMECEPGCLKVGYP
jgi:hypothetical protein